MTRVSLVGSTSAMLVAVASACASADVTPDDPLPNPDSSVQAPPEGSGDAGGAPVPPSPSTCSPAGWCKTTLPDEDLTFRSIWPLEGRAFATAESPTVGFKVLEWEGDSGKWKYIDDDSQNQPHFVPYISNIWALNENEVYYAIAWGTIYRGTRPSVGSPWTWMSYPLEDRSPVHLNHQYTHDYPLEAISGSPYPTLGVWGTKGGDVYAWYTNTIFHWTSLDGGPPSWVAEYTADDAVSDDAQGTYEELFALGATGTNADDVWFSFVRTDMAVDPASCPIVVRKTRSGYERISDGIPGAQRCRKTRPGLAMLGTERGWLTSLETMGVGQVAGLRGGRQVVKIAAEGTGYAITKTMVHALDPIGESARNVAPFFASLYPADGDRLWLGGTGMANAGMVLLGHDIWNDGASYQISTVSISGAPLAGSMYQLRGTSNTNLWLVGARHALHKTSL